MAGCAVRLLQTHDDAGYGRHMISLAHVSAGAALAASSALGLAVRTGRLDLGSCRWLHHVLYAGALGTAAGATVVDAVSGRPTWPAAAGTLGVLALLPATRGGSNGHVAVALAASAVYAVGTLATTRPPR
jgi:hypothetical protein